MFDVEYVGLFIEKCVGYKCIVGRLVLVFFFFVIYVVRVGVVEEGKYVIDIMFLFIFDVFINFINYFLFIVKLYEEKVKF